MPDDDIGAMFDGFFDEPQATAAYVEAPGAGPWEQAASLGLDGSDDSVTPGPLAPEAEPDQELAQSAAHGAAEPVDAPPEGEGGGVGFIFGASGGLLGGGLASINGAQPIRYNDLTDLLSANPGVTFTSLLPPSGVHAAAGAPGKAIAPDLYPTPTSALSVELGARLSIGAVDLATETSSSVATIAGVLSRADSFMGRFLGHKIDPGLKTPRAEIATGYLRNRLVEIANLWPTNSGASAELADRISSDVRGWAWQPTATVGVRNMHLRLQASRSWLAQRSFDLIAPSGEFIEADPDMTSVADTLSSGDVCFALVSIKSAKDALSAVFGKAFLPRGRCMWFAAHELDVFAEYASLNIERVVRCKAEAGGCMTVGGVLNLERAAASPLLAASVSAGLAYEAVLYGVSNVDAAPNAGLLSAWVRSMLRGSMLREALRLKKVGFDVTDIGLTHVSISVPKPNLSRLRSYMLTGTNLMLPVGWSWAA